MLDTICNTFGGVLFLAILVAMLLQLRGAASAVSAPASTEQRRLAELRLRVTELKSELESRQQQALDQSDVIRQLEWPDMSEQMKELKRLESERTSLVGERAQMVTELATTQESINQSAQELADLESALEQTQREQKSLEDALEREVESRTVKARLPVLFDSSKQPHNFCLRNGRLYRVHDRGSLNLQDFELKTDSGAVGVSPKPGGGKELGTGSQAKALFESEISGINPSSNHLAIFVWPDSFGAFQEIKSVLIDKQYEYRLVPLSKSVETLWQGSGNAKVMR